MRLYIELAKKSFQRQITYRSATIAGFMTNLFFGMLRASVMIAVYGTQSVVAGFSLNDAITYTGLTQALIGVMAIWGWFDVIKSIKSGEVASDLSRPFDYYGFWLAQDAGRALYQLVARGFTIMLAYVVIFNIVVPTGIDQWALALISLALGWLISFAWRLMISVSAFWVLDAIGLARMAYFLMAFPSGFLIPVSFMPVWLQAVCNATPFPSMINTPMTIYLGLARGADALRLIAVQAMWAMLLIAAGRALTALGRRQLTIQGG
jgi:ABC-2 type transport system permease protein